MDTIRFFTDEDVCGAIADTMHIPNTDSSALPKSLTPGLAATRLIAWGELFILIPMHAFWMLYRSTPLVAENTASAMVAAVCLLVLVVVGLASLIPRVRAALLAPSGSSIGPPPPAC